MLAALEPLVDEAILVVGFAEDELRAAAEAISPSPPLCFVSNPRYTDGSILRGVHRRPGFVETETVLMRSRTGSVRRMVYRSRRD